MIVPEDYTVELTVAAMRTFPAGLCLRRIKDSYSHMDPMCSHLYRGSSQLIMVAAPNDSNLLCPCVSSVNVQKPVKVLVQSECTPLLPREWAFVTCSSPMQQIYHLRPCPEVMEQTHYLHRPSDAEKVQASWCQTCFPDPSKVTYVHAVPNWEGILPYEVGTVYSACITYTTCLALVAAQAERGMYCLPNSVWFRVQPLGCVHRGLNGAVRSKYMKILEVLGSDEVTQLTTGCVEHVRTEGGTDRLSFNKAVQQTECPYDPSTRFRVFALCAVCVCLLVSFVK